ncbi:ATP-binding protein [Actinoplanes sp. NBRC 101535]|uniref:sensor histidine kinase n=1 Tax=Actinoplanes sp. NBRC 101535 TaxID=3032196 RepID=UPI0024A4EF21|nr:ATP-binding protein [Actinoplanes sp. NBRC 101535]GLY02638.1 hypothetical protein Acsp01_30170 [Actinoplanes sp. NBRC 101535]
MTSLLVDLPDLEQERLAALHEYALLDTPADDELTAVVRIAAELAGVPTASLNLIDATRQCQLTTVGFPGRDIDRSESMCDLHFRDGLLVHVPDARLHPDYATSPWVDGRRAQVRFYTSAPLVTPAGFALGTLCLFDTAVRTLTPGQQHRLEDLAVVLIGLFERRRQARLNAALAAETERQRLRLEIIHGELTQRQAQLATVVADLRRSNDELEGFAAAASHDLVRPLSGAHGYLDMITDRYGDDLDPQAVRWIDGAVRSLDRMQQLVTSLLDYARAGHATYEMVPVDLNDIMSSVTTDLRTAISDAGATILVRDRLPEVTGDPTMLRQLLQNLIDNAVKYHHPNRMPQVEVTCAFDADGWTVTVADNGVGIPAEHRDRVFAMFAQVDPAAGKGHGIGLSTCQRIMRGHHGSIGITDAPGGGAAFHLHLPRPTSGQVS